MGRKVRLNQHYGKRDWISEKRWNRNKARYDRLRGLSRRIGVMPQRQSTNYCHRHELISDYKTAFRWAADTILNQLNFKLLYDRGGRKPYWYGRTRDRPETDYLDFKLNGGHFEVVRSRWVIEGQSINTFFYALTVAFDDEKETEPKPVLHSEVVFRIPIMHVQHKLTRMLSRHLPDICPSTWSEDYMTSRVVLNTVVIGEAWRDELFKVGQKFSYLPWDNPQMVMCSDGKMLFNSELGKTDCDDILHYSIPELTGVLLSAKVNGKIAFFNSCGYNIYTFTDGVMTKESLTHTEFVNAAMKSNVI